jgi:hypothetical protein
MMNRRLKSVRWDFDAQRAYDRRGDDLLEQRPYLPPPEGDDYNSAYWSDSAQWHQLHPKAISRDADDDFDAEAATGDED